jgi:hypothetical protein
MAEGPEWRDSSMKVFLNTGLNGTIERLKIAMIWPRVSRIVGLVM